MYKVCRTEQSYQRQRQLEQGLLRLMLSTRYEDISISELCERLKIPRKSFYRYFSGKEGALCALLDHTMMDFYEDSDHSPNIGTPMGDLERFFVFWHKRKPLLDALNRNGLSQVLMDRALLLIRQEGLLPRNIRSYEADRQEVALAFSVCGLMAMIFRWHEMGFPILPREMAAIAADMLSKPLFPG